MNFPAELKYSKSHEWVKMLDETTALVGITDYAQKELGDLVFINLPMEGDEVTKETPFRKAVRENGYSVDMGAVKLLCRIQFSDGAKGLDHAGSRTHLSA